MGRNLVSVCDFCKEQLFYLRGKESPNIMRFYQNHGEHESSVRTFSDYQEEAPEEYEDVFEIYNPEIFKKELEKSTKGEGK